MDKTFRATMQKSPNRGGWTYVVVDGSAEFFGTKGLVKVSRHGRWRTIPKFIHGLGRRHAQVADQG